MSLVKLKDKRTGTTYIYESESYWDKEKKQPRSRRKLIGKLDEETGEIVPTGKSGRKKSSKTETAENSSTDLAAQHIRIIAEKEEQIGSAAPGPESRKPGAARTETGYFENT